MADKRGQPGTGDHKPGEAEARREGLRKQHRDRALGGIAHQRQDGRKLVARAQHIGRTRVARAIAARIRQTHRTADQHRKRNRADQIGQQEGDKRGHRERHQGIHG